jgi:hypothetical protein
MAPTMERITMKLKIEEFGIYFPSLWYDPVRDWKMHIGNRTLKSIIKNWLSEI